MWPEKTVHYEYLHMRAPIRLLELDISQKENRTKCSLSTVRCGEELRTAQQCSGILRMTCAELRDNPYWVLVCLVITSSDNASCLIKMTSEMADVFAEVLLLLQTDAYCSEIATWVEVVRGALMVRCVPLRSSSRSVDSFQDCPSFNFEFWQSGSSGAISKLLTTRFQSNPVFFEFSAWLE